MVSPLRTWANCCNYSWTSHFYINTRKGWNFCFVSRNSHTHIYTYLNFKTRNQPEEEKEKWRKKKTTFPTSCDQNVQLFEKNTQKKTRRKRQARVGEIECFSRLFVRGNLFLCRLYCSQKWGFSLALFFLSRWSWIKLKQKTEYKKKEKWRSFEGVEAYFT